MSAPNAAGTRIERFRQATAAAMRAMSGRAQLEVRFAPGPAQVDGDTVTLPGPDAALQAWHLPQVRGAADALAFWLRHHDPAAVPDSATLPAGAAACLLAAEQARVEALGSRLYAGSAQNLRAAREARVRREGFGGFTQLQQVPPATAFGLLIAAAINGSGAGPSAMRVAALWRPHLAPGAHLLLDRLATEIDTQAAFASSVRALIEALPADDLARMRARPGAEPTGQADAKPAPPDPVAPPPVTAAADAAPDPQAAADTRPPRDPRRLPVRERYAAFTTEFDRTCRAAAMAGKDQLRALHAQLLNSNPALQENVGRLARHLRRRLLAWQRRSWLQDLDDGLLDTTRLPEIVCDPAALPRHRQMAETRDQDTVVTLLIDNSGSMRGRPLTIAGWCADRVAHALEHCGIRVEILGYTTGAWKGGRPHRKWLAAGRPPRPGRLNELLHIVYKSADTAWRRSRRNLGLMLRRDLPRENIDGEALLWAHDRLRMRSENRRLLIVISDGGPADEITLSVNDRHLLDRHLRQTIAWIESLGQVELMAIGIGHAVGDYYRHAVSVENADTFAVTLVHEIASLFERHQAWCARAPLNPRRRTAV